MVALSGFKTVLRKEGISIDTEERTQSDGAVVAVREDQGSGRRLGDEGKLYQVPSSWLKIVVCAMVFWSGLRE